MANAGLPETAGGLLQSPPPLALVSSPVFGGVPDVEELAGAGGFESDPAAPFDTVPGPDT